MNLINVKQSQYTCVLQLSGVYLKLMIFRVVEFTHQAVDVRRSVSSDVGDEEGDQLGWHVVKYRTVSVHLGQDLT